MAIKKFLKLFFLILVLFAVSIGTIIKTNSGGRNYISASTSTTFEQRKQIWLSRNGTDADGGYYQPTVDNWMSGRGFILAWLANGKNDDPTPNKAGRVSDHIDYCISRLGQAGSLCSVTLIRALAQFGDQLKETDKTNIKKAFEGRAYSSPFAALTGRAIQYENTATSYIYNLKFNPSQEFTYNGTNNFSANFTGGSGTTYFYGSKYKVLDYTRDRLYSFLNNISKNGNSELDGTYQYLLINPLLLLYDFGEPEMKKRAKMMIDFMMLADGMKFAGNQKGGSVGRVRQEFYLRNRIWTSYLYALLGLGFDQDNTFNGSTYTTSYRASDLIQDLVHIEKESDSYWHLLMEHHSDKNFNKKTYVTPYYTLGSAEPSASPKWVLTLPANNRSIKLWINSTIKNEIPLQNFFCDADYINNGSNPSLECDKNWEQYLICPDINPDCIECTNCAPQAYKDVFPKLGSNNIIQYRNSFFVDGNYKSLHVFMEQDNFNEGMSNLVNNGNGYSGDYKLSGSGWNFFRKGKVALALRNNGQSWAGELAIISSNGDYPTFDAFKNAVETNSQVNAAKSFENSKGTILCRNFSLSDNLNCTGTVDNSIYNLPFDRMEAIYGYGEQEKGKLINWNNDIMTVSKNGRTCVYNFNNWTYSGSGCVSSMPACFCESWVAKNCGEGSCKESEIYMERTCNPLNCDIQSRCVENSSVCKQFLPFDLNGDGSVNVRDLGIIFSFWNSSGSSCGSFCVNDPDIDNSGSVFSGDVFSIFQNWTY